MTFASKSKGRWRWNGLLWTDVGPLESASLGLIVESIISVSLSKAAIAAWAYFCAWKRRSHVDWALRALGSSGSGMSARIAESAKVIGLVGTQSSGMIVFVYGRPIGARKGGGRTGK